MPKRLTAKEIVHTFTPGDYFPKWHDSYSDVESFWGSKLKDAKSRGSGDVSLYEDIKEHGQKKPISLNMETKEILDGHHRLASMYHLNPDQFVKYRAWKPQ